MDLYICFYKRCFIFYKKIIKYTEILAIIGKTFYV